MQKIVSYPLSIVYTVLFMFWLVLFHPIQWLCFNIFGYSAHKKSVAIMNLFLLRSSLILGTTHHFYGLDKLSKNVPLVIVCNHQSMHDIPPIIWFMRAWHPKFISKKELGSGIPSVSYNLKKGGSALIDRNDPKQALSIIKNTAEYINKNNFSIVIFPEGTRSRNGISKPFSVNGLKMLYKFAPDAYFVPITINNSWKMDKYGKFPKGLGAKISFQVHDPLKISEYSFEEIFEKTEKVINKHIKIE